MNQIRNSALYVGKVLHHRLRPKAHSLTYSIYSLLIDLDELDTLNTRLTLFSVNRFNLFAVHEKDYGNGDETPLKTYVTNTMETAGLAWSHGPIRLLTMPRILGYAFNPLSVFFIHNTNGSLAAILYEVNNTFGQRHSYLMGVENGATGRLVQNCDKCFYVSPFLDMALGYEFHIDAPQDSFALTIKVSDEQGLMLTAVQNETRVALTDKALLTAFITHPLLTLKVIGAIHWEALKIWVKGIKLVPRPNAPNHKVSVYNPLLKR